MKLLTKEQQESYENAKIYREYKGAVHSICNLKHSVSKKIPIVFHNGFNYDYHFIIKKVSRRI